MAAQAQPTLKPARLQPGDTIGLVAPASATFQQVELDIARESLEGLGLKVKVGAHIMDRHGSLGGQDKDRANDNPENATTKTANPRLFRADHQWRRCCL